MCVQISPRDDLGSWAGKYSVVRVYASQTPTTYYSVGKNVDPQEPFGYEVFVTVPGEGTQQNQYVDRLVFRTESSTLRDALNRLFEYSRQGENPHITGKIPSNSLPREKCYFDELM